MNVTWNTSNRKLNLFQTGSKNEQTIEYIKRLLKHFNIDPNIPSSCPNLEKLRQSKNWLDGPHTSIKIRNDFVHPKSKHGPISLEVQYQSWNLGQRYVELILLKLFKYYGRYKNRLTGEHEIVPWAK